MKKGKLVRRGLTLLEITIAVFILILGIMPIYHLLTGQTAQNIETGKMQMADKIMQSIKEEMTSLPYKTLIERSRTAIRDPLGQFELTDDLYPVTLNRVLEIQKQFKDFQVTGTWMFINRGDPRDTSLTQVNTKVTWTQSQTVRERSNSFLLVAPK